MQSSWLWRYLAIVPLTGCSQIFGLEAPTRADAIEMLADAGADSQSRSDGALPFLPLRVPPAAWAPGSADLTVTTTIDTTSLLIDNEAARAGIVFDLWEQAEGPQIAVLHVRGFTIPMTDTVRVTGLRPLVVIASHPIVIGGTLDAGARHATPGAGGSGPGVGAGSGGAGSHADMFRDSGGGGGGYGTAGGVGGLGGFGCLPSAAGGQAGAIYGSATGALVGGSGGGTGSGTPSGCPTTPGGAGGGAIQLSSAAGVYIQGRINVGGGGGGAGRGAGCVQASAGSGGGSGGMLVLQAPVIQASGTLAANGGAGGSSGGDVDGDANPPFVDGLPGEDGQLTASRSSPGADAGRWSSAGGAGAAAALPAVGGADDTECDGNGGGAGGGAGRIVIAMPAGAAATLLGVVSPGPSAVTY